MKHIAIFDNMADVQTALNEEVLVKPYVALVSGALDYNTLEPTPHIYVQDSSGNYYYPQEVTEGNVLYYQFEFTIDATDSWTLYKDNEPVEAEDGYFFTYNECNGNSNTVDQLAFPHTFENETYTGGFDDPSLAVSLNYTPSTSYVNGSVTAQYCDGSASTSSAES